MKKIMIMWIAISMVFASCSTNSDDNDYYPIIQVPKESDKGNKPVTTNEGNVTENGNSQTVGDEKNNGESKNDGKSSDDEKNKPVTQDNPTNEENVTENGNSQTVSENKNWCNIDENTNIFKLKYMLHYNNDAKEMSVPPFSEEIISKNENFYMETSIPITETTSLRIRFAVENNNNETLSLRNYSSSGYYTFQNVTKEGDTVHIYISLKA